jgi:hypothetical protein
MLFTLTDSQDNTFPKKEPPKPKPLTDSDLRVAALTALTEARHSLASDPLAPHPMSHEAGKGELNHASTWDEFPNGRFGDIKSPAYGGGVDLWTSGVAKVNSHVPALYTKVSPTSVSRS